MRGYVYCREGGIMGISTAKITSIVLSLFSIAISAMAAPALTVSQDSVSLFPEATTSSEDPAMTPDGWVELDDTSYTYDGALHSPALVFKGGREYTEGTDYTMSGTTEAKDAGVYTIDITCHAEDTFTVSKIWSITKRTISVMPTDTSKHIGMSDPTLSYTTEGLVEGDSLVGISVTRKDGEEVGAYTISVHDEGLNPNYLLDLSATGTFLIEAHQFERGENVVIENQVPASCTRDGSHDEVYYCLSDECGAECLRIHVTDSTLGHDFSDTFTIDISATCERAGTKSKHCSRCYQRIENTIIPATGHTWSEGYITIEPTCTENGELTYYCLNYSCQATKTEETEPAGHMFEEEYTLDFPPSCEQEGQESRHCTICDAITDIRAIPALGHSWNSGTVSKKPTCVEPGIRRYRCTVENCGGTKEEEIEALGHDFMEEFITDTFPTCTKTGSKSWHCSRCREVDNITIIPARGHKWNKGDTTGHPTCESEGMILFTCTSYNCGATDTTFIPAKGHAWDEGIISKEATCTEKGAIFHICTREECDATKTVETDALGHDFNPEYTIDMPATCTRSGKKSQHCSRCDERINNTLIAATGHAWGEPNIVIASTCTTSGILSYPCIHGNCQQTRTQVTNKLGHEFSYKYTTDVEATCTQAGKKSKHCIRCDEKIESVVIPATGHLAGDTVIDRNISATCTEQGELSHAVFCLNCHAELWRSTETTPAIGHNWDDGKFIIAPTTENMGKKEFTCLNCKKTRYETVEKLHKDIIMREYTDGTIFSVKSEGYCPGSEDPISYTVLEGVPVDFRLEYSEQAKTQGFKDMDWTFVSADSRINIITPEQCEAGKYDANVYFRDENQIVTKAYPVQFTVNLSQAYLVPIFEDVVSIDNRSNLFHSFQWYHNGKMIYGASKPYYQEIGGLTGSYYVKINEGTDSEMRTCSRNTWESISQGKKRISVSDNPIKEDVTVTLHNFDDSQHTLSVINQLGSTILTERFSENAITLSTNLIPPGNYIINVDGISLKVIKE